MKDCKDIAKKIEDMERSKRETLAKMNDYVKALDVEIAELEKAMKDSANDDTPDAYVEAELMKQKAVSKKNFYLQRIETVKNGSEVGREEVKATYNAINERQKGAVSEALRKIEKLQNEINGIVEEAAGIIRSGNDLVTRYQKIAEPKENIIINEHLYNMLNYIAEVRKATALVKLEL